MAKTLIGFDLQATMMGGGFPQSAPGATPMGYSGTASATSATSLTIGGVSWVAHQLRGQIVVAGSVYGNIIDNSTTVLTIDRWIVPATPSGSNGSTPSGTTTFFVIPATSPFCFMGLSANGSPSTSDTALTGEIVTSGGGLIRKICPFSHVASSTTYVLTPVFTMNGSDSPVTVASIGMFQNLPSTPTSATGNPLFTTLLNATALLSSPGDQLTVTETVTM